MESSAQRHGSIWPLQQAGFLQTSNLQGAISCLDGSAVFSKICEGKHLQILSDSMTTIAYINRIGGSSKDFWILWQSIWSTVEMNGVTICTCYLASKLNKDTEPTFHMKRHYIQQFWNNWIHMGPTYCVPLCSIYHNSQITSLYWDSETSWVNTMGQIDWRDTQQLANSPFWLISRILNLIIATVTLIAPKVARAEVVSMSLQYAGGQPNQNSKPSEVTTSSSTKDQAWKKQIMADFVTMASL